MVANPITAADLRRIADGMTECEVVLADIWDRVNACQHEMPDMTGEQWIRFCRWFSDDCPGLSIDLSDYMERFAKSERGSEREMKEYLIKTYDVRMGDDMLRLFEHWLGAWTNRRRDTGETGEPAYFIVRLDGKAAKIHIHVRVKEEGD